MDTLMVEYPLTVEHEVSAALCAECLKKTAVQIVIRPEAALAQQMIRHTMVTATVERWDDLANATWEDAEWR